MEIRRASESDAEAMWEIFGSVIATGDTLPFFESIDRNVFRSHWFVGATSYVAETNAGIVGMYKLNANYPDLGSHVASATYLVRPSAQGRGIGRTLVEHSIMQARSEGFAAMQFNYVVSTNIAAVGLYRTLGFAIVGTLPNAFRHRTLGLVDVYVMHRHL